MAVCSKRKTATFEIAGNIKNKREEEKEMELRVNEITLPEAISFNYEELKAELTAQIKKYETMVYTEDQIKVAKEDRASLNKLKKALNDERIRREREYMQPFNMFKAQINEIIGIIDKPVALIDGQVKEFEEKQKKEKAEMIALIFESTAHPEWLKIEQIFNPKWLNASVNQRTITEEIDNAIENINNNLSALQILPEFSFEAIEVYKTTLDINKALEEGKRLAEIQKRKAEAEAQKIVAEEVPTVTPGQKPSAEVTPEPKEWVSFKALLSASDATALKTFFYSRGIKYEAI